MTPDVIVVGAGPAGSATSIFLAERGLRVLALDRARFPRAKICGEYLSPETLRILDRLGVLKTLDAAGATPLGGMRITAPDGTAVTGRYRPVGAWRPYRDHALALGRDVLDTILVDRARALGVDVRDRTRVTDVFVENGRVVGVEAMDAAMRVHRLRAPLVVAADGRSSIVARRLGLVRPHRLQRMALVTYVAGLRDVGDVGEIFIDPPDYAILNPLAPDRVNMSIVVPLAHASAWSHRLDDFFAARVFHMPHLARRLAGAARTTRVQAMGPLAYAVASPTVGGLLMVGDAAGFYDPLTGEGVFSALRGAELASEVAADALASGDCSAERLAAYGRARDRVFAGKARFTRGLQFLVKHRALANLTGALLDRRPALLDRLLGVVGDYVPPRALLF